MGLANRELYLTNTNDETGKVLLSAWIPEKKEDGLYYQPKNTPIGLDLWVPNTIGVTYEEGPVPIKVLPSDVETGIWLLCVNDYFGNEQHLLTIKPIHKKEKERRNDFNGWSNWEIDDDNDENCGFSLHVFAPSVNTVAGDEPVPVTFERGFAEYDKNSPRLPWKPSRKKEKKENLLKRIFKKK